LHRPGSLIEFSFELGPRVAGCRSDTLLSSFPGGETMEQNRARRHFHRCQMY